MFFCRCQINVKWIEYFVNVSFRIKSSFIKYRSNDTVCGNRTPYAYLLVIKGKLNWCMRIFTTSVPVVLWVTIFWEIKISIVCEKCQLRIKKPIMHMIDKPITNPHSFFIIHRFNLGYNSPVLIASKIFKENFVIHDWHHQVFPHLKHNFFLTVFCQLKCCRFERSSLIWKLYLQTDMLCLEI
jgi:hypothetical protein